MPINPLVRTVKSAAAPAPVVSSNGFGVPTITPRARAIAPAPAGHAPAAQANPYDTSSVDLDFVNDPELAALIREPDLSGVEGGGDLTSNQLTDRDRQRIADQNRALINAGAAAIGMIGTTITAAIVAGSQTEIARINAESRIAAARYLAEAQAAQRAGNAEAERLAAQRAADAYSLARLTQTAPSGPSTTTLLLIGGGVLAGVFLLTRMGRGARRNPSGGMTYANPVLVRGRGRHKQRKFFSPSQARKARRRGWKKAR